MEPKNQNQVRAKILYLAVKSKETVEKIIQNSDSNTLIAVSALGLSFASLVRPTKATHNNFIQINLFHF